MSNPAISVIMPVYNTGSYLHDSISSILKQTFTDFEFIIINDGSTDNSEDIILSYKDNRIKYLKNKKNEGLISSLNLGIQMSKGEFTARMDGDDISLPTRFEKQKNWLDQNPDAAIAGSHVTFINAEGKKTGEWELDEQTKSSKEIRRTMVRENCLAHPSVMMRTEIIKRLRYATNQKNTEDYDLWLRILAEGGVIGKVPEKLLLYRVHQSSITGSILRKSNPFFKQYHCKKKFLIERIKSGKWSGFDMQVLFAMLKDGLMGIAKNIKNTIKN